MTIINTETYKTIIYTIEDQTTGHEYYVTKSDSWSSDILFPEYNIVDEDDNEVEDQELINRLKWVIEEHPKQIKCYCGHTTTCDCSPLEEPKQEENEIIDISDHDGIGNAVDNLNNEPPQETLEEAAEKYAKTAEGIDIPYQNGLYYGFVEGAKWQAERMYSEEEVRLILDKTLIEYSDIVLADIPEWFEQFKKKQQ